MTAPANPIRIDYSPLTFKQRVKNYVRTLPKQAPSYILSLFPIIRWIHRYNFSWLMQDMIAGITVGMLIVPQGIAYAKVATLDSQYGLYTSFVGVSLYCFFGTSKDISIGPITVVSLLVGEAIARVKETHPEITGPEVAVCLSLFTGLVLILIGLVRLGILVDFISEPAIAGYMTGSAITISMGQWPKVLGLHQVNTHDAPYAIFVSLMKHLPETQLDAAFGLIALGALYVIKIGGARLSRRVPSLKQALFYIGIMRSGLIVVLGTAISYAVVIRRPDDATPIINIIQDVPAGFDAMAVPSINWTILKEASGVLPSIVIILILEHVSVAASFGRASNYTINPNQEILAIGMSNVIGAFFGAYPCTGAFSRTAVMSRSGAKTPMAGVFSGAIVVLALYALTPAFYYIPESVLGAVVIHAVLDLISGPTFLKQFWKYSVLESIIFIIAVVMTCFLDVETAIYTSVATSLFFMLLRLARPRVISMGRVRLSTTSNHNSNNNNYAYSVASMSSATAYSNHTSPSHMHEDAYTLNMDTHARFIYVDETDVHFQQALCPLPPGIVVIQLTQSILYPNAHHVTERIMEIITERTRPNENNGHSNITLESAWNQPSLKENVCYSVKPHLQCLILDFYAVATLDATALHTLSSLRTRLLTYTQGRSIEWHFCHLQPNVRQSLVDAGFGSLPQQQTIAEGSLVVVADNNSSNSLCDPMGAMMAVDLYYYPSIHDKQPFVELCPVDNTYPAFHWDVEAAVYSVCKRWKEQRQQPDHSSPIHVAIY